MHQPGEFYDVETNEEPQYHLDSVGSKDFKLLRRFGYVDLMPPHHNFQVPKDLSTFRTDLTSTPAYFTWLIPGLGVHLPAVLLHDGLVFGKNEEPTYIGPPISRLEADRIFRDAMKALGTGPIRRWLIWAAVALATSWQDLTPGIWWKSLGIATVVTMLILGGLATVDLFDYYDAYPWMGERSFIRELIGGGIGALVIPFFISIPWGRLYLAALIATIAFAFLIHVTLVIAFLLAIYEGFERVARIIETRMTRFQKSPLPTE